MLLLSQFQNLALAELGQRVRLLTHVHTHRPALDSQPLPLRLSIFIFDLLHNFYQYFVQVQTGALGSRLRAFPTDHPLQDVSQQLLEMVPVDEAACLP